MLQRRLLLVRDAAPGKPGFAKRALAFAKRARRRGPPPGYPMLWIACIAAAGTMIVTGGFGTGELPLASRTAFWLLLMGWNGLKWQLWFMATVRGPRDWLAASLVGSVLLALPLPLEILLASRAVGDGGAMPSLFATWARAFAIAAVILATILLVFRALGLGLLPPRQGEAAREGLLQRARVLPGQLAAIEAEDHYCRVRRSDGQSALVHYRFGDALAEVAGLDGAQVHRGAWVAEAAVLGAEREGRRWRLLLAGGVSVPVSATYAAAARGRGWLRPPPAGRASA